MQMLPFSMLVGIGKSCNLSRERSLLLLDKFILGTGLYRKEQCNSCISFGLEKQEHTDM